MKKRNAKTKVTAIVPSAGKGLRFESSEKKPFAKLNKRPLLSYALTALQSSSLVEDIVLVTDKCFFEQAKRLITRYGITKIKHVAEGGRTRADSVRNGLRCMDKDTSVVLIHDGVRPFVSEKVIRKTIKAALKFSASVSAVPVKATIKVSRKDSFVRYTPNRDYLWEVQTPQAFKKNLIVNAYRNTKYVSRFTDDAALLESKGKRVKIVRGDYSNIKITTVEDIKIAEALLGEVTKVR